MSISDKDRELRRRIWTKKTGLKSSSSKYKSLPEEFLSNYKNPTKLNYPNKEVDLSIFDHNELFYHPDYDLYVLLSEPYANGKTIKQELEKLVLSYNICYEIGSIDTGIWNPGMCLPFLIADGKDSSKFFDKKDLLKFFIKTIPEIFN